MSKQRLPRIIPVLLLNKSGLYKTLKFKDPKYIGDPLNAVKIFNEKEVDELVFLDIHAFSENRKPDFVYLEQIASECFMPLCYGGGISTIEEIKKLINIGIEKISFNSIALKDPSFIKKASDEFGSSTIVVSIDAKKNFWGKYEIFNRSKFKFSFTDPEQFAVEMNRLGAGEIMINSVDKDGTQAGYDLELVKKIASAVDIPVIASGGASSLMDFKLAIHESKASAAAAGSMFVFHGKHRAVLISYPDQTELRNTFFPK
jgi:cyclase